MRALAVLIAIALLAFLGLRHLERTRPQDLPWTPLDLTAPIGMATRMKLERLAQDPALCTALLAQAGIETGAVADRRDGPRCGYTSARVLRRSTIAYSPQPLRLTCPMVAALAVWERRVVRPQAKLLLGSEVARIDHFGSYSCRRISGRDSGSWSEHSTANALDVAAFNLADGREVSVLRDWPKSGPEAAFLRAAHDGACKVFGTTLGPEYNAAHGNHFHMDMKPWAACR